MLMMFFFLTFYNRLCGMFLQESQIALNNTKKNSLDRVSQYVLFS